jgi:hypothetical protein
LEEWTLRAAAAPADLGLAFARQLLCRYRRRIVARTGVVLSDETVYALTSLTPEQAHPADLLRL